MAYLTTMLTPQAHFRKKHLKIKKIKKLKIHPRSTIVESPLIFLDIETTGLLVERGHRICEIAIIRGPQEHEHDLVWLIKPTRSISKSATELHGISDELIEQAPHFGDIADVLISELTSHIVVGHNIWFDLKFIVTELNLLGYPLPSLWCIDTLSLTKKYEPQLTPHTLSHLSFKLIGEPPVHLHQAEHDARLCAQLFVKIIQDHQLHTLAQCGVRRWRYTL